MRLIDLDEFLRQNCVDRIEGKSCEECKHHVLEVSCERLMELPTIDPVKHGRWVKAEKGGEWWYACSICSSHIPKTLWGQDWHSSYCPNCGATMMEGEEENGQEMQ